MLPKVKLDIDGEYMGIISFILKIVNSKKVNFGKRVNINRSDEFCGNNFIGNNTIFKNSFLGYSSYVSHDSDISFAYIGKFSSIGPNVNIIIGNHPTNFITTHPSFYSENTKNTLKKIYTSSTKFNEIPQIEGPNGKYYSAIIGNDVWIGSNVSILNGVKIGDGAIIGSNAFVNKDVEPYSIVVGIPGKTIKKRFSKKIIDELLDIKWWDFDEEKLNKVAEYVNDPETFISLMRNSESE